ncbi:short-chain dehydrogenase reductase family oxidoreductase [Colletotrichum truncatum]|uniref:Short-chain dehydrogenase reductase family oxidoreductase n=1 Tax=Colletotrichum truncatum TaxID=5467 RepID=A0ACC3YM92_COLTU|nr:short-chain dehydrogenase reductase family oxidoreductase [Colletotrichum truncatum]KAF6791542.1 short-chain dehydrogenase reductase family oxidoreductase [Colletotrichum truncatum]
MSSKSEFTAETTAIEVAAAFPGSIANRTFIITGVSPNSIGFATAEALASQKPARLVLAGRSIEKVNETIISLRSRYPEVVYDALLLDLSSQASVRAAADKINSSADIPKIHGIINNAGIMAIPEKTLVDGVELTFATNHVGHFLFTNLVIEKLIAAVKASETPVRIVNLTSFGHFFAPVRFSDINLDKKSVDLPEEERPLLEMTKQFYGQDLSDVSYDGMMAYAQSKTANVLYTISLNQKLGGKYGIESFAVHPGAVDTNISQHVSQEEMDALKDRVSKMGIPLIQKTKEQGANTSVLAAVDPSLGPVDLSADVAKGVYLADCKATEDGCAPHAKRLKDAERLWELTEGLVKQKFHF